MGNLMFKEEEDGSVKVKIVDWQMTYTGSVGGDITYLLMSSIAPELYEAEEDNIKERYFEKFNSILKSFVAERKRSLVEAMLEKEYNESLPLGFLFSCYNCIYFIFYCFFKKEYDLQHLFMNVNNSNEDC